MAVPEDCEGISLEALDRKLAALGDRATADFVLLFSDGEQSTGTILSNARRRELYEIAADLSRRQERGIPIFFDLAYEWLLHDPRVERPRSVLPEDDLGIAYEIGTLSKIIAPALRIGYLLGPDGPFLQAMIQKTSDTGFSAPPFVQEMAAYLLDHGVEEQLQAVNAGYRQKAAAVRKAIDRELGGYLEECRGGSGGFYFYLTMAETETHSTSHFFRALAEGHGDGPRILYIPGEYCVHPRGDLASLGRRQMRLSYGFESAETIARALGVMREAASR